MAKISRNAPCPCGSEIKYKKCCLQKDDANQTKSKLADISKLVKPSNPSIVQSGTGVFVENELDILSNSVVDLINAGELDKAEEKCLELLNRYPDVVDGFERFAMLYEARGEKLKAVEYYEKAAAFMKANPGYDKELIDNALTKVEQLS